MTEVNEYKLEFMPLLKQQLKLYVGINYEEDADYSNYSLVKEYHMRVHFITKPKSNFI